MKSRKKRKIILILSVIFLFIAASFVSREYTESLEYYLMTKGQLSDFIYILITISAVVLAPISTLPLLPIAVTLWGPNLAAIYTIIGWLTGAMIAFIVARIFGKKFVCKFINVCHINDYSEYIPKKNMFWMVVLARVILPVDIFSYIIGIFTSIHWFQYMVATLIGIVPFAFVFAHGATLPISIQIFGGFMFFIIFFYSYGNIKKQFRY